MAMRSAMHQTGAPALTQLLQFPAPAQNIGRSVPSRFSPPWAKSKRLALTIRALIVTPAMRVLAGLEVTTKSVERTAEAIGICPSSLASRFPSSPSNGRHRRAGREERGAGAAPTPSSPSAVVNPTAALRIAGRLGGSPAPLLCRTPLALISPLGPRGRSAGSGRSTPANRRHFRPPGSGNPASVV